MNRIHNQRERICVFFFSVVIEKKELLLRLYFWNCFYSLGICLSVKSCAMLNSFCVISIVYARGRCVFFLFCVYLPRSVVVIFMWFLRYSFFFFSLFFHQRSRAHSIYVYFVFKSNKADNHRFFFFFLWFCFKRRKCTLL